MKLGVKRSDLVALGLVLVCSAVLVCSLLSVLRWYLATRENNAIKEDLQESIAIEMGSDGAEEREYRVDFTALKQQNSDTVGYLKVGGTDIDYVVVQGNDNDYYLNHNFNKSWNQSGWIFADYRNALDESDKNVVIYGHNMGDGSMFGTLMRVLFEDWQSDEENLRSVLVTEQAWHEYRVFSTYIAAPEDYYITTAFASEEEFGAFVDELKSRSNHDYGVEVGADDKILTLSSCIGDGDKRVVLHAKLVRRGTPGNYWKKAR